MFAYIEKNKAFYRQVAFIMIPMIVQNTITNVVGLLDNLMVGNVGTLPMSGVAIVNQLMFVFYICIWGGLSGPDIYGTQYAGSGNHDGIRYCFRIKLLVALVVTALFTLCFSWYPDELIQLFLKGDSASGDIEATLKYAKDYLFVMVFNMLPFSLAMVYATSLRSLGETRMPMFASISAIIVNLFFNYLLIFGKWGCPQMGVTGAAVATVMSRVVELCIIVIYTHVKRQRFCFIQHAYIPFRIPLELLEKVGKCGWLLWLNELLWSAGLAAVFQGFSLRGLQVVAAGNIAMTVANVFTCIFYSTGGAVAILVGQELGANRPDEAEAVGWRLNRLGCTMALALTIVVCFLAPFIPELYQTEEDVRKLATVMLWITASYWPCRAFVHNCFFMIRAGGRSVLTTLLDSGFMWIVRMPVVWYIGYGTSMSIGPFYFITYWLVALQCVIATLMVKKSDWRKRLV